ncbi:MAG TPA: VOC family protein [Kofleriaceae bacterium]|nr:VOC family protein [Kofleriaceae bacterium]
MKPTPPGWPRISTALYYDDPRTAIDWLMTAFGFELKLLVEGDAGEVVHSELTFGDGLVMVGGTRKKPGHMEYATPPGAVGGANTQNLMVYVDDVEAHIARARAAGATITKELEVSDYGTDHWADRGYECRDVGGHHWWFYQRLRTLGQPAS